MVEADGIEPTTPCLQSRWLSQLSYAPKEGTQSQQPRGGPGRTRTSDPTLIKRVL